jgi:hypothetical protein
MRVSAAVEQTVAEVSSASKQTALNITVETAVGEMIEVVRFNVSRNMLVLSANHHRQFHFGYVKLIEHAAEQIVVRLDDEVHALPLGFARAAAIASSEASRVSCRSASLLCDRANLHSTVAHPDGVVADLASAAARQLRQPHEV